MYTGTVLCISTDHESFLVEFDNGRRWNVFMLAPGCQVQLQPGDLVKGRLDSMREEQLVRLRGSERFKAFGQLVADDREAAQKLIN